MNTLAATKRTLIGNKSKGLAASGELPAVVYGPKQEALSVALSAAEFEQVLKTAGESSVIELVGVTSAPLQVLVHDVDRDPVSGAVRHVDLYAIEKGAKVEVSVPLVFTNESPAVKAGASLVKVLHEVEIEAAPADLPQSIEVDISVLQNIDDQIHAKDLLLPSGVTLITEPEEVVVLVQEVAEETEEAAAPIDMSAIEVEKKGKEEAGEAAA